MKSHFHFKERGFKTIKQIIKTFRNKMNNVISTISYSDNLPNIFGSNEPTFVDNKQINKITTTFSIRNSASSERERERERENV